MKYIGEKINKEGIYIITNITNNKCYIGSSVNIYSRYSTHFSKLKLNKHVNKYLQNAYNKSKFFEFKILELTSNLEEREEYWINNYNSNNRFFGYNLRVVCKSTKGYKHTEENKQKLRISLLGIKRSLMSNLTKEKLSTIGKNKIVSKETCSKISKNHSKHNLGKKHTLEHRQLISKANKGRVTNKVLIKMSISMQGKNSKFTVKDILEIKLLIKNGIKLKDIASQYKVNPVTISDIKREHTWKHVKLENKIILKTKGNQIT